MRVFKDLANPELAAMLRAGAIGVLPTDTLYGIVASAAHPLAIQRLYDARSRDAVKACIVLIGDIAQITDVSLLMPVHQSLMQDYWPGSVSIVLPVTAATPEFLPKIDNTVAYRLPAKSDLRQLLRQTGPLLAPSANPQGQTPASTVQQAQAYFGDTVDFYVDGGDLTGNQPSTLVRVAADGNIEVLRGTLPAKI